MYSVVLNHINFKIYALALQIQNVAQIDQCLLCARCDLPYSKTNDTREFCTDLTSINSQVELKKIKGKTTDYSKEKFINETCFRYGDFCDVIGGIESNTSIVSILPPTNADICYFNISYYDLSQNSEIFLDTVYVDHKNESEQPSMNGKWASKKICINCYSYQVEYNVIAKHGMFNYIIFILPMNLN